MTNLQKLLNNIEKKQTSLLELMQVLDEEAPKAVALLRAYKATYLLVNGDKFLIREIEHVTRAPWSKIVGLSIEKIPQ